LNDSTKISKYDSFQANNNQDLNDPERKKALQIHSSIKNAGDSLARSTQIAIETEQIGTSVLGELNEQGEKLRKTNDTLDDTSAALSKSRKLINTLSKGYKYFDYYI
jgi:vesicle transport through interaction with t-SNAREs protein 1